MTPEELVKLMPSKETQGKILRQAVAERDAFWIALSLGEDAGTAWLEKELQSIWGPDAPFIPKAHEQTK